MRIGFTEMLVVFVVALLVIGPDRLPLYAKKFGEALAGFRKASEEATNEIKKNIVEPLDEAQRPLREAMAPVEELRQSVEGNVRDVRNSLNRVGRGKPAEQRSTEQKPGEQGEQKPEEQPAEQEPTLSGVIQEGKLNETGTP